MIYKNFAIFEKKFDYNLSPMQKIHISSIRIYLFVVFIHDILSKFRRRFLKYLK